MPQHLKRINICCLLFCVLLISSFQVHAATLQELYEAAVDAYNNAQYDKSIELYQQINKDAPQFAPAYLGLGLALKAKGADIEEVIYYYKTAVEKAPDNVAILDQLGRLYYSIGQMNRAQVVFEKALKINPNLPDIKLNLAWIYLTGQRTNTGRAIIYFQDVLKVSQTPNIYFGLGMAYFAENKREKALDMITQLKSMEQDELAGRLEKAMRENRRVVSPDFYAPSQEQEDPSHDFEKTSDDPKGVKVRLRGKLDEL